MRKTLMLLLALALVLGVIFVLAACGETPATSTEGGDKTTTPAETTEEKPADERVTYTVIVKDQNGNPVEGVEVQICEGDTCKKPKITGLDGKVTFKFKPNGDPLKVQINGENSVSGYVYPTEPTYLEDGETTKEITIEAQSTYTVTASDLFGGKVADIAVDLYASATNTLVERKVTDEKGSVKFIVDQGNYYVKITHVNNNPAYVFSNPDEEGGNTKIFKKGENSFDASIIVLTDEIPYTVTVKNADGSVVKNAPVTLYDRTNAPVSYGFTDDKGVATLSAVNGNYYAVATAGKVTSVLSFVKNGAAAGEITVGTAEAGSSKDAAIYAGNNFTVKSGEVWYFIPSAYKKVLTVDSASAEVVYNGKTYTAEGGKVTVPLSEGEGEAAYFVIKTNNEPQASVSMPGSESAPFVLNAAEVNGKKITLTLRAGETVYYTFVADKNGTVALSSDAALSLTVNGYAKRFVVNAGESVTVAIGAVASVSAEVTLSYGETKSDYRFVTKMDGETVSGVKVVLYKLENGSYVKVTEGISENGSVLFADVTDSRDYYVSVVYTDYTLYNEYLEVLEPETELYLIHVADGSAEYPFGVTTDSEGNPTATEGTVAAGTSVWYTLNVLPNDILTVTNRDVTVKIYLDTNGNGIPDGEDTPVVPEWDDTANAYTYTFTLSGVDRELCKIEVYGAAASSFTLTVTEGEATEE